MGFRAHLRGEAFVDPVDQRDETAMIVVDGGMACEKRRWEFDLFHGYG